MSWRSRIVLVVVACTALTSCSRREEPGAERSAPSTEASQSTEVGGPGQPVAQMADTAGVDSMLSAGPPLFGYMKGFVGSTPIESSLWRSQPLAPILYKILGPRFETFLINMQEATPLREQDGVVYVTGHKKYGEDKAALVVDTETDAIYVWLLVAGKTEEYQWGDSVGIPKPVLELVEQADATP